MDAVIYQVEERPWAGMLPVAGRPLVVRQIEWLIAAGFKRVAVEVSGAAGEAIARRLSREGALGGRPRLVRTPHAQGARLAARKAGFGGDDPLLALPGDVLGDGDVSQLLRDARRELWAEGEAPLDRLRGGSLRVLSPRTSRSRAQAPGWAVQLRSAEDALLLSAAALSGQLPARGGEHLWPILVHGAEIAPGVWIARGARVDAAARVIGPAFIGTRAIVCAGAQVGPSALVGERAVVERGARVAEAVVADDTLVGEGVQVERSLAAAGGLYDLESRRAVRLPDPLLLGARVKPSSGVGGFSRLVALTVALLLAAPAALSHLWSLSRGRASFRAVRAACCRAGPPSVEGVGESAIIDLLCRLLDVAQGLRPLAGPEQRLCPGCRNLVSSLAEMGATTEAEELPPRLERQRLGREEI